jgi:uncharacterized membrane protein YeaQ/YmgE (transglycosylase-associated protein family)
MINVFLWCLVGGLIGFAIGRLKKTFPYPFMQIVAGCFGALIGGTVFTIFDTTPLAMFSISGLAIAILGALIALSIVQTTMARVDEHIGKSDRRE